MSCLKKSAVYVGQRQQPKKGSTDAAVAQAAKRNKRVILTSNYEMVLTACEIGARFIWFDRRKNNATMLETAFILLRRWDAWEEALADPSVDCLKVGREAIEPLTIEDARRRAERRFKATTAKRRSALKRKEDNQQVLALSYEDDE